MVRTWGILIAIVFSICISGLPVVAQTTSDDLLYNPSQEFIDDFFLKLSDGSYIYAEDDASIVMRRLFSFK